MESKYLKNIGLKNIGLYMLIAIGFVGLGFVVGSVGVSQNNLNDGPQNTLEKPVDLPANLSVDLKKHMDGPYLRTPYGVVKIEGASESPPEELTNLKDDKVDLKIEGMQVKSDKVKKELTNLKDDKEDLKIKGAQVSSAKVKQYIHKKYGESVENLEILIDSDKKIKVINKKQNKMYVLYLNENGDVRSSLVTSAVAPRSNATK